MKKTGLLVLLMIGIHLMTHAQNASECKKWKTGRFYMMTPDGVRIEIARKGNTQVEYNTKTGDKLHSKIKWLSPCKYQLRDDPKFEDKDDYPQMIITVEIVEIKDNFIMIEFTSNMFSMKLREPFYRSDK